MKFKKIFLRTAPFGLLFVWSCSSTGVNPTGMMGGQIMCPSGPRPAIDCRGVLQQYSRDLKVDLSLMSKTTVGLGLTSTKLTEADALTSDLLQHSYQTCTLYNACIVSPQDYGAKTEKLQELQLQVRRTLLGGGFGQQQNIQINPVPPGQFPPGFQAPGAPPQSFPGQPIPGQQFPNQPQPGQPFPGPQPFPAPPPQGAIPPPFDPNMAQQQQFPGQPVPQQPNTAQFPVGSQPGAPVANVTVPNATGSQTGDAILNILREGSKLLRGPAAAPVQSATATLQAMNQPPAAPVQSAMITPQTVNQPIGVPAQDLDSALRAMLQSLKKDVVQRNPGLANASAVVGNFTEEGQPWSGPMGALLQDHVSNIVMTDNMFPQATGVQSRGITVKDVQAVGNVNDPRALTTLYNSDLAIAGTYQARPDGIAVKLTALQKSGEIAQENRMIPSNAIPDVVAATAQNASDTNQLIDSLHQAAPRADGQILISTNRPGPGSSFRMGEPITYFVTSNNDGYLYLFHVDGEKNVNQIFPNQFQANPRIRGGQAVQVPQPGAPFKFEASPPFGLETTFAIVTPGPLNDKDLQTIQASFASAKQVAPAIMQARGIAVSPAGPPAPAASSSVLWNSVTVLIRP